MNKKIIIVLSICISFFITGCEGNSNSSNNIQGVWISECHELVDADDGTFMAYVIDTYNFDSTSYTLKSDYYEENTCITPSGIVDNYIGNYTLGENVVSLSGAMVTRISFTRESPDWPEHIEPVEFEAVYKISGVNLNFGLYEAGITPEIIYDITYTKQEDL